MENVIKSHSLEKRKNKIILFINSNQQNNMSDNIEIQNLIFDEQMNDALSTYSESSLEYINDYNGGSYQGQINVDTLVCERKYVTWSDGWISIPITVAGLSDVYSASSATMGSGVVTNNDTTNTVY